MFTAVIIVHVLVSIVLIITVLLQSGKGASIGASFGGAGSQTLFGSAGPAGFLVKITIACAVIFMATSMYMTLGSGRGTVSSVMTEVKAVKVKKKAVAAKKPAVAKKSAPKAKKAAPITKIEETALKPAPIVGKKKAAKKSVVKKSTVKKKKVVKKAAPAKKKSVKSKKAPSKTKAAPHKKKAAPAAVKPAK